MVSISHVVEDIVKHRPYLSESLAAGYCDGLESVGALFAGAGAGAVE